MKGKWDLVQDSRGVLSYQGSTVCIDFVLQTKATCSLTQPASTD